MEGDINCRVIRRRSLRDFFFFFVCGRKIREMWKINFCSIEIEWIRIPFIWKFYILWLIARKPSFYYLNYLCNLIRNFTRYIEFETIEELIHRALDVMVAKLFLNIVKYSN